MLEKANLNAIEHGNGHIRENAIQLEKMSELLKDLKYGSITITVQDGKIVQIDKVEKIRVKSESTNRGLSVC